MSAIFIGLEVSIKGVFTVYILLTKIKHTFFFNIYFLIFQHENKENESDNTNCKNEEEENIPQKSDEVLHPEEETIKNGIPHETVNEPEAVSKLPKYLDNLPYEEGIII